MSKQKPMCNNSHIGFGANLVKLRGYSVSLTTVNSAPALRPNTSGK